MILSATPTVSSMLRYTRDGGHTHETLSGVVAHLQVRLYLAGDCEFEPFPQVGPSRIRIALLPGGPHPGLIDPTTLSLSTLILPKAISR